MEVAAFTAFWVVVVIGWWFVWTMDSGRECPRCGDDTNTVKYPNVCGTGDSWKCHRCNVWFPD